MEAKKHFATKSIEEVVEVSLNPTKTVRFIKLNKEDNEHNK